MKNSSAVKRFIRENAELFWYIKPEAKKDISNEFLVETILNYGDYKAVKKMFRLLGKSKVERIFYTQISRTRHNYFKLVKYFFNIYFQRNAGKNAF
jgi:hypothetical protein